MNTRQLQQGLTPHRDFEKKHTYYTLRHFPEIRMALTDVNKMPLRAPPVDEDNFAPLINRRMGGKAPDGDSTVSPSFRQKMQYRSTHRLEELSKSSMEEITQNSALNDFRRLLVQNRRRNAGLAALGSRSSNNLLSAHKTQRTSSVSVTDASSSAAAVDDDVTSMNTANAPITMHSRSAGSQLPQPTGLYSTHVRDEFDEEEDPLLAANKRLTKFSVSYDARSLNVHTKGFHYILTKKALDSQLRKCLNIYLKKRELDALFYSMDYDDSGLIDGVEFIRYFFQLGTEARWEKHVERVRRLAREAEEEKRKKIDAENRMKAWEAAQIADFTAEDRDSAMKKLKQVALTWDPANHIECLYIEGFQEHLSTYRFKQQLDKSFALKLTNAELGALVAEFKTREGEFCIDGPLFLKRFGALKAQALQECKIERKVNQRAKEKKMKEGLNGMEFYLSQPLGR